MCLFTLQTCYTLFPSNPTMFKQPPPLQNALLTLKQLMCLFTPYHLQTCYTLFPSIPTKIFLMFKHQPLLQNNLLTTKKCVFSRHTNYKHAATNTYEHNLTLHALCNLQPISTYSIFFYVCATIITAKWIQKSYEAYSINLQVGCMDSPSTFYCEYEWWTYLTLYLYKKTILNFLLHNPH